MGQNKHFQIIWRLVIWNRCCGRGSDRSRHGSGSSFRENSGSGPDPEEKLIRTLEEEKNLNPSFVKIRIRIQTDHSWKNPIPKLEGKNEL